MPVLYLLSDFFYVIVYYILGYRKNVVMDNLKTAFPKKTREERVSITKKFYKNFCDTFIETVKFISADKKFFHKRFKADYSIINELHKTGKSIQIHLGHNFNWELANLAIPLFVDYKILGVYKPLHNKLFNKLFHKIRSKHGSHLIATSNMRHDMHPHRNTQYLIGLIADQSPHNLSKVYWVNFFDIPTAFLKGPEKAARQNNFPVVFCHFTKVKRGYYHGYAELATLHPANMVEGELTQIYAQYLERVMSEQPDMWLWSHRRWKHKWKPEYGDVL